MAIIGKMIGINSEATSFQFNKLLGYSFDQFTDLVVKVVDQDNLPLDAVSFTITGSLGNDGIETLDTYLQVTVGNSDTFDVEVSKSGYTTEIVSVTFIGGVSQFILVQLVSTSVAFTCTTEFIGLDGANLGTISETEDTIIRTTYTTSSPIDHTEWIHILTLFPATGDKYSGVEIPTTFISNNGTEVVYEGTVTAGQFSGDIDVTSRIK